jgi:hypothetical protein
VSEEPTTPEEEAEAVARMNKIYTASRAIVRFCRILDLNPRESFACLSTSLALVLRQSGTPWGPEQLKAIELCIQLEIDHPMAERKDDVPEPGRA